MRDTFIIDITDTLYEHDSVRLCRGSMLGGTPVLVKTLSEVPSATASAILEHEKSIIDSLSGEGVIRALRIAEVRREPALVLEHNDSLPLALTRPGGTLTTTAFLRLALTLAELVGRIHEKGVVHGNLSPWAIFVPEGALTPGRDQPEEEALTPGRDLPQGTPGLNLSEGGALPRGVRKLPEAALTRFEYSFNEGDAPKKDLLHRFLSFHYISPEATGKVDLMQGTRSDLYSLGAVLYWLMAGRPPFTGDRPADLAYAHLSAIPESPANLNPQLPAMVSKIIMKLLKKNPDDRYQGAVGVAADLRKCLEQAEKGRGIASFKPGNMDESNRPRFPERLYDREDEMAALSRVYNAVDAGGNVLSMVAGETGSGKTALVMEFARVARKRGALFVSGKFEQYRGGVPFSAFIEAFRELTRGLLMGTGREVAGWKNKLTDALAPNAGLIAELIPELAIVMGEQEPVQPTAPLSAMNRLRLYIAKFLSVFASAGSPLFIFLDDLHRADPASLGLLWLLSADEGLGHIGIIGAYRSEEVPDVHPLAGLISTMSHDRKIITISPRPLDKQAIARAIADMFHTSPVKTRALADLVHDKTMGTPYFVREFLGAIAQGPMVSRRPRGGFQWDIEGIRRLPVTDNMVDFLAQKIGGLPGGARECLMTAACIGTTFETGLLGRATGMEEPAVGEHLSALAEERLVIPNCDGYRFAHDKVQEAALMMIPENIRTATHAWVGYILFDLAVRDGTPDSIFGAVDQLNHAAGIMTEREKIELSDLNYLAGRKARRHASFQTALAYFKRAMELLMAVHASPGEAWERFPHLAFVLHRDLAEAEYLNGNADRVDTVIGEALPRVSDPFDRAELANILILQYATQFTRSGEALEIGLGILVSLGIEIDTGDPRRSLEMNMERVTGLIAGREAAAFIDLPPLRDEKLAMSLKILRNTSLPAVYTDFETADTIILCMTAISIESGNAPESVVGYLHYGRMLGMRFGRYLEGYRFGRLALDLAYRMEAKALICESSLIFANFIAPRYLPLDEIELINRSGITAGKEGGELKYTGDIYSHIPLNSFCRGHNLGKVYDQARAAVTFLNRTGDRFDMDINAGQMTVIRYLKDTAPDDMERIAGKEKELRLAWSESGHSIPLKIFYFFLGMAEYLLGNPARSLRIFRDAALTGTNMGLTMISESLYYQSLCILALLVKATGGDKDELTTLLFRARDMLKSLSETCPQSFMAKHLLVEAEAARIAGRDLEAMDLYDRAIDRARIDGFTQVEAITCELAGKYWLGRGKDGFARIYLDDAHQAYLKWGALRKVRDIEERYATYIAKERRDLERVGFGRRKNDRSPYAEPLIDISQRIMGEIHLERLHELILTTAVMFVSAKKGFIIMERNSKLFVEAEIDPSTQEARILGARPLSRASLPRSLVQYCARTGEIIDLSKQSYAAMFMSDPYIQRCRPKSVLCLRLSYGKSTSTIIYLENSILAGAFSVLPPEVLSLLSTGMSIAIENARLYREQEESIALRDKLLREYENSRNKNLQERMRPHFIYNAVHTIHALLRIDPARADAALLNFAEISRYFTDRSFESQVAFSEEWKFSERFLEFERIRLKDKFSCTMEMAGNFGDILVPPLIIQPLAGNSIKHGFKEKKSGGVIAVYARREGDRITIEVRDNGSGLRTKDPFSRTLGNIRDRVRYFHPDADIAVHSARNRGVRVTITFTAGRGDRHERNT